MSYEKDLNMVMTAINMATTLNMSQSEEEELIGRIKDVYAKAEAFDAVLKIFIEEYIESESRNRPYEFITAMRDLIEEYLIAEYLIAEYESEAD